jgi:large subunit ribosomal protein L15
LTETFQADTEVNPESLEKAHLLRDPRNPIVILGRGEMKAALKVRAHRVSAGAKKKIEEAGGSVELIG